MSVYSYIQGSKNDGSVLFAKDGILIKDLVEINENVKQIEKFIILSRNKTRPTYIKRGNQHIFVNFHKEKDVGDRRREFFIIWNSTDSKNTILENAKLISVTDEFDYDNLKKIRQNNNMILYILAIIIAFILYKIFKN